MLLRPLVLRLLLLTVARLCDWFSGVAAGSKKCVQMIMARNWAIVSAGTAGAGREACWAWHATTAPRATMRSCRCEKVTTVVA